MQPQPTTIRFNKQISDSSWHLRLERHDFEFKAGELITLYGKDRHACRDYSVASGEQDDFLDILYRPIEHGALTPELVTLQAGQGIETSGPTGRFTLRDTARPVVCIATGTGIAPCRAYYRSHPSLALTLIHGVRDVDDLFFYEEWQTCAYFPCISGPASSSKDFFNGRLTALLPSCTFPDNAHFYLCGANEMIYEVEEILEKLGVPSNAVFREPYYYRWDD